MYLGFWFYLGMARHPEVEMFVMKEDIYIHTSLETGGRAGHAIPGGKHLGQPRVRGKRVEESRGKNLYCTFHGNE